MVSPERETMLTTDSNQPYHLCLMRHGIAAGIEEAAGDDSRRPLTPEGRTKMKEIARGLERLGVTFEGILASPLIRAMETAEIVARTIGGNERAEVCEGLAPHGSLEAVLASLQKHPGWRRFLLVGHEPSLSDLAARWVGAGQHASLAFKKGGCCLIEFENLGVKSTGELVWWLTPKILRKLGSGKSVS